MHSNGLGTAKPSFGGVVGNIGVSIDNHQLERGLCLAINSRFIHGNLWLQLKEIDEGVSDLARIDGCLIDDA